MFLKRCFQRFLERGAFVEVPKKGSSVAIRGGASRKVPSPRHLFRDLKGASHRTTPKHPVGTF